MSLRPVITSINFPLHCIIQPTSVAESIFAEFVKQCTLIQLISIFYIMSRTLITWILWKFSFANNVIDAFHHKWSTHNDDVFDMIHTWEYLFSNNGKFKKEMNKVLFALLKIVCTVSMAWLIFQHYSTALFWIIYDQKKEKILLFQGKAELE